jgi:copper chaperone CopZ
MNTFARRAAAVLGLVLLPCGAFAEMQQVQITATGLDCASCARAMVAAVKKLDGVESVDVSVEKGFVAITLAADNKVTLPQLRRTIRSNGHETKEAHIAGRGRIVERDGKPILDLLNGATMELESAVSPIPDGVVNVAGVSIERERNVERLTIAAIKK